ncbi:hypothetical protein [Streptomyces sp. NRRL B-24484]|uniref:hypothetical protein n=1 Tax=Streptomyces sp. NRRL B-24484 TaxID=1463833 RepID=UPI0004C090B6|nr:hypothetical protein [Streptomyces sp. NRRL B-24484]
MNRHELSPAHPETAISSFNPRPSDSALAEALAAGTVLLELRYRGNRHQIVATNYGVFGRHDVLGCYLDIRPQTLNQWTRFPGPTTAAAWCRDTAASMLRNSSQTGVDRDFAVWHGNGWSVEIDLHRQQYTIAVGMSPGVAYEVLEARADQKEAAADVEARGWAWLLARMPEAPDRWPGSMADEYCRRVLLATT